MKDIPGYAHLYAADIEGNIWGIKNGKMKLLKPWKNDAGYCRVGLTKDRKCKGKMVHRLVLEAYVGSGEGLDGDHINGIKNDNRLDNLRWLNHSANMKEAAKLPVYQRRKRPIIGVHTETGETVNFESIMDARRHGFNGAISEACRGIRPTSSGYRWAYL